VHRKGAILILAPRVQLYLARARARARTARNRRVSFVFQLQRDVIAIALLTARNSSCERPSEPRYRWILRRLSFLVGRKGGHFRNFSPAAGKTARAERWRVLFASSGHPVKRTLFLMEF